MRRYAPYPDRLVPPPELDGRSLVALAGIIVAVPLVEWALATPADAAILVGLLLVASPALAGRRSR